MSNTRCAEQNVTEHPLFIESREWQADDLLPLIAKPNPLFPELEAARANLAALRSSPQAQVILAQTEPLMADIANIPQPKYTAYRRFIKDGDREEYEEPYFTRRAKLSALVFRCFLGIETGLPLKTLVEDYIWAICEETNWVLPAHEGRPIDLFSAETAFTLAQTLALLGDQLDAEVAHRIYAEVDRRVLEPYLRWHYSMWWYLGGTTGTASAIARLRRRSCCSTATRGAWPRRLPSPSAASKPSSRLHSRATAARMRAWAIGATA